MKKGKKCSSGCFNTWLNQCLQILLIQLVAIYSFVRPFKTVDFNRSLSSFFATNLNNTIGRKITKLKTCFFNEVFNIYTPVTTLAVANK